MAAMSVSLVRVAMAASPLSSPVGGCRGEGKSFPGEPFVGQDLGAGESEQDKHGQR